MLRLASNASRSGQGTLEGVPSISSMDAERFGMASRPLQRYAFAGERVQLGDFRNAIDHKSILGGITRLPSDPPAGSCNGEDKYHSWTCCAARVLRLMALNSRPRHCRRMMVHNQPVLPIVHEREAVARWKRRRRSVFYKGKGIVAGVDGGCAINSDQLLAE